MKHYKPNGTGRDIYVFHNHGGFTKGNKVIKKNSLNKYKDFLRSSKQIPKVGLFLNIFYCFSNKRIKIFLKQELKT